MKKHLLILLGLILSCNILCAKIFLSSVFTDNMVLQQNSRVKIWGTSDSDKEIRFSCSWLKSDIRTRPDEYGKWAVYIQTLPADYKEYNFVVSQGKEKLSIENVIFGEVWLCSGQSNMEMKMRGQYRGPINGGPDAILNSKNDYLRIFNVKKVFSYTPLNDVEANWERATPATVSECSASAYFFASQLQKTLDVPVGIMIAPWGGALVAAFMSGESLKDFPKHKLPKSNEEIKKANLTPSAVYNGMIHPLIGYSIKGVIWYQGETNRYDPKAYKKEFKTMVQDWRDKWGIGQFPFVYAQIAPYSYGGDMNSAYLREAQLECLNDIPNSSMICLLDVGEKNNIHPAEKKIVGQRFAMAALDKVYKIKGITSDGPMFKSMQLKDGKIIISFKNADNGLTSYGQELDQFQVAGSDKVFYYAKAWIKDYKVILECDKVSEPKYIRYGFTDYTKGTLYNVEGCPATSFRTDKD